MRIEDPFSSISTFQTADGSVGEFHELNSLEKLGICNLETLPYTIRCLLEAALRKCDGFLVTEEDVRNIAAWTPSMQPSEIPFSPSRVILQDFTGVPAVVDIAALRDAMVDLGGDPEMVNPQVPVDLVVDHSVQVDFSGLFPDARERNLEMEYHRNMERYKFLKRGQQSIDTFREVPPRLHSGIEKFTAIWVPFVLFGALVVWYFAFPDDWKIVLLLWVVACPCALLLATPVPHAAALARSAHIGAIARGGDVIERLSKVNHVLLDKTGTLTSGKPRIGEVVIAKGRRRDSALKLAAGLELRSSHPYALSVMEHVNKEGLEPTKVNALSDIEAGVRGKVGGKEVAFIRYDRAKTLKITVPKELKDAYAIAETHGHGASLLAREGKALALFTFIHDDTLDGSRHLIPSLIGRDITIEILSGDNQSAVKAFAKSVGLDENAAHGGLSPEQKVDWVRERSKTHVTMMVGDGFNDAAALAVADVGVAVGSGETVNLEAADVLVPSDDPQMLTELVDLSRRAQAILVSNLVISVGITLALVGAVVAQMYDELWVGVLIHEASVILVILNGARLAGTQGAIVLLRNIFVSLWRDTKTALKMLYARLAS